MSSSHIAALRSVALNVPDVEAATRFYTDVWHLSLVSHTHDAAYLRGTGPAHHVLSLHGADRTAVRNVTFQARSMDALHVVAGSVVDAGGRVLQAVQDIAEPGGGTGLTIADADGRVLRIVHGDASHTDGHDERDRPIRLAHVVLNCHEVATAQQFFERVLGFRLSDRTRIMAFMRCNSDHHSVALADADQDSLNHIAFLMPDVDSVMRGGGRLRDAGHPIEWGPGRHGPGNNAFNYFVDPNGVAIEYTAEVLQVDDSYRTGGPDDWKWPSGRVDHWGISGPPSQHLKEVQKAICFAPAA
ncbi:MAG: VOC family protein [Pseudomonadota bacterium]|nr:VOC family protein [Pseudomonadota bacterium]